MKKLALLAILIPTLVSAATFQYFSPATGILKGNSSTYVTSTAVSSDVTSLWTGSCSSTTFLRGDGACQAPPSGTPGNPAASLGLSAINGSASTYMRSDASPALSQSIVPTWSGLHTFNAGATINASTFTLLGTSQSSPIIWNAASAGTDQKKWDSISTTSALQFRAVNDAYTNANAWVTVNRGSGFTISNVTFPSLVALSNGVNVTGNESLAGQLSLTAQTGNNINILPEGSGATIQSALQYFSDNNLYLDAPRTGTPTGGQIFLRCGSASSTCLNLNASGVLTIPQPSSGTWAAIINGISSAGGIHVVQGGSNVVGIRIEDAGTQDTTLDIDTNNGEGSVRISGSSGTNTFSIYTAGTSRATFNTGLAMAGATGGDEGSGTINAKAYYVNGNALPTTGNITSQVTQTFTWSVNSGCTTTGTTGTVTVTTITGSGGSGTAIIKIPRIACTSSGSSPSMQITGSCPSSGPASLATQVSSWVMESASVDSLAFAVYTCSAGSGALTISLATGGNTSSTVSTTGTANATESIIVNN